ncbi:NADPH-dependent FMN reductase [Demequina sp. SYSU T00068]|uniref:NADPH-dependent FMN reductase n=1 Tax=Demequina lignilytica TaxID=3051663 RepID=UPI00262E458C|nr:NADPH-dependent FMN reductase [Demequina sp. SYSU T00068]MDN4490367.1 NADPH-dependent FMN reductase [Demequina sp. SYSU T00068]
MPVIGLLLGQLPHARTARQLATMLHAAAPSGTTLVEISTAELPFHAPYADMPTPAGAIAFKRALADVDGLLIITPSHERSIPGALKHAIDWASASPSSLEGKPVVIAGASAPRSGYFAALQHLRTVLNDAGARLMGQPERTLAVAPHCFGGSGRCVDAELDSQVSELVSAAAGYVAHLSRERVATAERPVIDTAAGRLSTEETRRPMRVLQRLEVRGDGGPASPVDGTPSPFVDTASTIDPLVATGDPAILAFSTETTTGAPG